jgi:hypothetical protein
MAYLLFGQVHFKPELNSHSCLNEVKVQVHSLKRELAFWIEQFKRLVLISTRYAIKRIVRVLLFLVDGNQMHLWVISQSEIDSKSVSLAYNSILNSTSRPSSDVYFTISHVNRISR